MGEKLPQSVIDQIKRLLSYQHTDVKKSLPRILQLAETQNVGNLCAVFEELDDAIKDDLIRDNPPQIRKSGKTVVCTFTFKPNNQWKKMTMKVTKGNPDKGEKDDYYYEYIWIDKAGKEHGASKATEDEYRHYVSWKHVAKGYLTEDHTGWLNRRIWLDQFRKLIKGMPSTVEREEVQQVLDEVFVKRVMDT